MHRSSHLLDRLSGLVKAGREAGSLGGKEASARSQLPTTRWLLQYFVKARSVT
jgi:hypothetical protein